VRHTTTALLCLFLIAASALVSLAAVGPNLVKNGDFVKVRDGVPVEWGLGPGAARVNASPKGGPCLRIISPIAQYSTAVQYIPIDGSRVKKVRFTGRVRFRDVKRGENDYDVLRAFIMWFDRKGLQVGDYADAGAWTGTANWRDFSADLEVPAEARRAQLVLGLHECSGTCYFANIEIRATAGDLTYTGQGNSQTDTRGWWPFTASVTPATGTAIDLSNIADAPAGKHGFLTARDGHLYFQDGTRARFWGFDIMGEECFPDHETAEKLAARLQRMGVNIMRLHHLDASWSDPNIFDPKFNDTQHLSSESLDCLDYFMYQLKKRGIYIYWDWLVNRHFKAGDEVTDYKLVDDGAKIVAHFDPRMIELEKKYMSQLLNHKNRYTGKLYRDEPQIAMSEVINEDSLFYEDWYDLVPPHYLNELTRICRKYEPKANPAHHPFDPPTIRALYRIESGYYKDMRAYLKKLGLKCPTTGSNHWENIGPALLADSETDYIDRHYYWDHPKDGYGWKQEFDNLPMLADYEGSILPAIAGAKVAGKPMVVTEWCNCWVNDFIAEGPLAAASYACLQDWDAMIWFDISSSQPNSAMDNEFDISNKPQLFAQWAAAALMFHRRDLQPFDRVARRQVTRGDLLKGAQLITGSDIRKPLTARIEAQIVSTKLPRPMTPLPPAPKQTCKWDEDAGNLVVRSPRTIALDGFLNRAKQYDLGWVRASIRSEFCVVWLTSLDGKPLSESKDVLITAAARAENTGTQFNQGRTHLVSSGKAPILVEPVNAVMTFPSEVEIRPLAQDGRPGPPIKTNRLNMGQYKTFWYEVTR